MANRERPIQKKLWLTPQEEKLIEHKMKQLGTRNFGAYARKMLIDGYIIKVDYTEQKKLAAAVNKISEHRIHTQEGHIGTASPLGHTRNGQQFSHIAFCKGTPFRRTLLRR